MTRKDKFTLRLICLPFSAFFLFVLLSNTARSVDDLLFYYVYGESLSSPFFLFTVGSIAPFILGIAVASHIVLETVSYFRPRFTFRRTLAHLRYGPFMVLFLSGVIVLGFDALMIEVSRWQIRNYVYGSQPLDTRPDLDLHNNYRGWCGNGIFANIEYLYYDTAAAGLTDTNPEVRARSFLAAARIGSPWSGSGRFEANAIAACSDEDQMVRQTAENYLAGIRSSCARALSEEGRR